MVSGVGSGCGHDPNGCYVQLGESENENDRPVYVNAAGWGYGPCAPFAVKPELGGSRGLKRFVDAAAADDVVERRPGVGPLEGRRAREALVDEHAERPPVGGGAVADLRRHLGRDERRRAAEGVQARPVVLDPLREPQVAEDGPAGGAEGEATRQQHILRLEVAVHDVLVVQVLEGIKHARGVKERVLVRDVLVRPACWVQVQVVEELAAHARLEQHVERDAALEGRRELGLATRPDALLATLGGQTALNTAIALHASGVLERYGVELIGADVDAIERGENREKFRSIVESIGGSSARSIICHTMEQCVEATSDLGYPVVVRPSFTMGGAGSGIAYDEADLERIAGAGLQASPTTEVLLEESIIGWKEYELELMRDKNDNVVVVCSIENVDPMGVHTGDSITVAPCLTLTDREYQHMRDVGIKIIRAVGVDTGGCNIQFAINPADGRMIVIETFERWRQPRGPPHGSKTNRETAP